MKKLLTFDEHKKIKEEKIEESFKIKKKELPKVSNMVDRVAYKEGDKIAYVDFNGTKNIPVHVEDDIDVTEEPLETTDTTL